MLFRSNRLQQSVQHHQNHLHNLLQAIRFATQQRLYKQRSKLDLWKKTGNLATTFMGQIHESSIPSIALGFKFGMPETLATSGIGGGLYSDIKLGSTSELKFFFGITF